MDVDRQPANDEITNLLARKRLEHLLQVRRLHRRSV